MEELIGLIAGACTTGAFLPQVIKVFRTKRTQDISLLMYIIFSLGVSLWLVYGFMIASLPMILANGLTLLLAITILIFKIVHRS